VYDNVAVLPGRTLDAESLFFIRSLSFLLATLLWLLLFLVKGVGFNLQCEPARVRGHHPGFAVALAGPRPLTLVLLICADWVSSTLSIFLANLGLPSYPSSTKRRLRNYCERINEAARHSTHVPCSKIRRGCNTPCKKQALYSKIMRSLLDISGPCFKTISMLTQAFTTWYSGKTVVCFLSVRTLQYYWKILYQGCVDFDTLGINSESILAHAGGLASENSNIVSLLFLTFSQYHEMQPTISVPTPKTPHKETSRDQRLCCHTLYYDAGWT
jgi:hypothetical protein